MYDEITVNVISELAKSSVSGMFNKMKDIWSSSSLKIQEELIESYESYLKKSSEKHSKMKTLLYKRNPVDLYKFYESIDVKVNERTIHTKDIKNLLDVSDKLIITGTGGIGKSTMLKHIFMNCVENKYAVPVLVELRGLNEKNESIDVEDLISHIYETVKSLDFSSEIFYFKQGLELGENLILFDGLDELKRDTYDSMIKSIKDFCDIYSNCKIIITSRPSDEFIGWNDFTEVEALKMNKSQALSLIKKIDFDQEIKDRFYVSLENELFEKYESFASIPLLLTIMLITFEDNASIPEELNDFYEKAFVALFSNHDASKSGFKRDILSKLGYEDFKSVFSHVCFKSYFAGDLEFNEDKILTYVKQGLKSQKLDGKVQEEDFLRDLTNSICMLIKDGLNYRFAHRSFQEYFAAVYTSKLDDEMQKVIFNNVFKNNNNIIFENKYIRMFREMQKERFIKNALHPLLKTIIDESRSIIEIFEESYNAILLFDKKVFLGIDSHLNSIIFDYMEELFDIRISRNEERLAKLMDEIKIHLQNENNGEEDDEISVSTFTKFGLIDELLLAVGDYEKYILDLRKWVNEYDKKYTILGDDLEELLSLI